MKKKLWLLLRKNLQFYFGLRPLNHSSCPYCGFDRIVEDRTPLFKIKLVWCLRCGEEW